MPLCCYLENKKGWLDADTYLHVKTGAVEFPLFHRTVKACLDLLVPWLHLYIDSQDSGSKAFCDVNLHGPFYTACQAVFYTLIFRHNAILEGNMKKGQYMWNLAVYTLLNQILRPGETQVFTFFTDGL